MGKIVRIKFYQCFVFMSLLSCRPSEPLEEKPALQLQFHETIADIPKKTLPRRSYGCGPIPSEFREEPYSLDPFYQQYCDAGGIPVLASISVDSRALRVIKTRAITMMQNLAPPVKQAMINAQTRIAIIGQDEVTTDIPEHSDLYEQYPNTDWNVRARGLGATPERPVSSSAEENALCLTGDKYTGADIFVHEFAHTIHKLGLRTALPDFDKNLDSAYTAAMKQGLWKDTYAATNSSEYWAEGVQSWFNLNFEIQEGVHNHVNTRAELKHYDRELYALVAKYMPVSSLLMCSN